MEKIQKSIKVKKSFSLAQFLTMVFFILYTATIIFMFSWAFINAVKDPLLYYANSWNIPSSPTFANFITAYDYFRYPITDAYGVWYAKLPDMFLNSVLYAGGGALASCLTIALTAYLTARFPYKLSKIIYVVCFVALILPIIGNLPSQLQIAKALGLYDSIVGMWIMRANFLSTYYLIFHAFFSSIPQSYFEAAKIDGANNWQILIQIAVPFAVKLFTAVYILVFIGMWNDYETPNMWLPSHPVLSVGLLNFSESTEGAISSMPVQLAGALIVSLPAFLLFFVFRNTLVGNVTMGGLKE